MTGLGRTALGWAARVSLLALWAFAVAPAGAAAAPAADDDCLMCHASPDLTRGADGSPVAVRAAELRASVHAGVGCVGCHPGSSPIPHPERLPAARCQSCHADADSAVAHSAHRPVGGRDACVACHGAHGVKRARGAGAGMCRSCHGEVVADYDASVHGVALARGDDEASRCRDCHGRAHEMRSHRDPASAVARANLAQTCARCHADRELMTRRKITIPEAYALYRESVHGRSGEAGAATCNDCHESHRLRRATDSQSSIYRTNIPATCGRCHAREAQEYGTGVHGTAVERGVTASPVCTDCHGEHLIRGPRDARSPVGPAGITQTCAHCHEATGIRETFGLPAGRVESYRDSYHGLAARGGSPVVANCASCHGYHQILPSSDPRSEIHPSHLPETCGKCHPGAGSRFALGPVHVALATKDQPLLYYVRWAYLWLIAAVIGGMLLHNGLDFYGKLRRSLRRHLGAAGAAAQHGAAATLRWFERMTLSERIQHGLLATSFFALVYTGFALKHPESWLFSWLARLEHGYAWRSVLHRIAAVVQVGAAVYHLYYLTTRRGRGFVADMVPRLQDARDAADNLLYLAGRRADPPRFDRFGYVEKAEYWALVWGTVVMTSTGLALWFANQSLRWVDKWVLDLATVIHYYEAWLAFLAIVVWHLYFVIANPDTYPMNWTWLTGRISEEHLRHEHPLEWERLTAAERRAEEPAVRPDGTVEGTDTPA